MKHPVKYILALLMCVIAGSANAQNAEMADSFRADGKIYVVVAVILIVLAGLIVYLFLMDRKLVKLERELGKRKQTNP
jgi:CcmD family protein